MSAQCEMFPEPATCGTCAEWTNRGNNKGREHTMGYTSGAGGVVIRHGKCPLLPDELDEDGGGVATRLEDEPACRKHRDA
jgi:hypothetical protein